MNEKLMRANGLKNGQFKPKAKEQSPYIEDDKGNKYKQVIQDGQITLKLVEDSKGIMYE